MLDIRKNPISIVGGWDSPASCYKIHAAVLFLHEVAYPETCGGPYITNCPECEHLNQHLGAQLQGDGSSTSITTNPVQMIEEEDEEAASTSALNNLSQSLGLFRSCISHANAPNLRTKGNILSNPATRNHYNAWLKLKDKLHVTKGCGQLYPSEVRKIRNHLLSRGDPVSSQMWVMILLGIRKFLRSDELISLTVEDFINSYHPKGKLYPLPPNGTGALTKCQVVHPDSVRSLAGEVQGK